MKRRCARPNCRKRVKYTSPADLCSKHWNMWWDYGVRGKDTWWLRAIKRAADFRAAVNALSDLET